MIAIDDKELSTLSVDRSAEHLALNHSYLEESCKVGTRNLTKHIALCESLSLGEQLNRGYDVGKRTISANNNMRTQKVSL